MRSLTLAKRAAALLGSAALASGLLVAAGSAAAQPDPDAHSQEAHPPNSSFTMKWTRADAQNIMERLSDPTAPAGTSSLDTDVTMPDIPRDFPVMKDQSGHQVWVWDTWPLTDGRGNQYSFKGWDVIFSLVADPFAGYTFDDRHVHARIGFWYRKTGRPGDPWIYGGKIFGERTPEGHAEWSGSTRVFPDGSIKVFYTAMDFTDRDRPEAVISLSEGKLKANKQGVRINGLDSTTPLLEPDGDRYQTVDQNPFVNFRDPFTFVDPKDPSKTYMVFEGNTAGDRGAYQCQSSDLGDSGEDPGAVTGSGANFQMANIGLAVATNADLSQWEFLDPILSANCVNDQTERPQFVIKQENGQWKYYLLTISHQFTYAAGLRGPDGVYGFVGNGIRSDFQPLNSGSGLAMGNPTNLNEASGSPEAGSRQFQAYSHYVMPGGLVESFIDNVAGRRGGTLAPTVKLNIAGQSATVDRSVGTGGLLPYGFIPSNASIRPRRASTVTASASAVTYGRSGAVRVLVTSGKKFATGGVTLSAGGRVISRATLSRGAATLAVPPRALPAGTHRLSVSYGGSESALPASTAVTMRVSKARSALTASLLRSQIQQGQRGRVAVRVRVPAVTATGRVVVVYRGRTVGRATLRNQRAVITLARLSPGSKRLSVRYLGTSNITSDRANVRLRVVRR